MDSDICPDNERTGHDSQLDGILEIQILDAGDDGVLLSRSSAVKNNPKMPIEPVMVMGCAITTSAGMAK